MFPLNPLRRIADWVAATFAPNSTARSRSKERIVATYDAAQTNRHNANHWGDADYLSPNASTTVQIRHTLRSRSRLEAANNSLYCGVLRSIADHTVGSGPKIQWLHESPRINRDLTSLWDEWDAAAQFGSKLWLAKETQSRDGEIFGLRIGNPKLTSRVKLDYQLLEADYVTSLRPQWTPWQVDGITYDTQWNPVSYQIVTQRPNDILPIVWPQQHTVPADQVFHYFRRERPGQGRGVPDLVAAFELLAVLRRYITATVSAAEVAASFAAFIKTQSSAIAGAPADDGPSGDAWVTMEIQRNLITMLPDGYDVSQLKPEQPTQSFTEFVKTLLTLLVRCVSMPLNLALCDSSGYNYSSSRMDHQTYYRAIEIDRRRIELTILVRVLNDFLREAELILGLARFTLRRVAHEWHWPRPVSADPQKDAASNREAIESGQISITDALKKSGGGGDIIRENAEYFGVTEDEMRQIQLDALFKKSAAPAPAKDESQSPSQEPPSATRPPDRSQARHKRKLAQPADLACGATVELVCQAESAQLDVSAAAGDVNAVPKFAMVGYTGGAMWLEGHEYQLVIDLATVEVASPETPILFAHDDEQTLGHAAQVRVDGSGIFVPAGQGFFSAANARRDEVVNAARRKYPWQASVGGRAASIEFVEAGQTVDVNGRTFQGPIEVARGFRLREISILSLGADAATSAQLAAHAARLKAKEGTAMPRPGFEEWCRAMGFEVAEMSNQQTQAMQNLYQSQEAEADQEEQDAPRREQEEAESDEHDEEAEAPDQSDAFDEEAAEGEEEHAEEDDEEERPSKARRAAAGGQAVATRTRTPARATTRANAQRGSRNRTVIKAANPARKYREQLAAEMRRADRIRRECGDDLKLAAKAIEKGWGLEKVQLHMLRAQRSEGVMAGPLARPAGSPDHNAVIECSMLLAIGGQNRISESDLPKLDKRYTEQVIDCAVSREDRHYTFSRLFQEYLLCHNRRPRAGSLDQETIEAALMIADREIRAEPGAGGSSFSTISLPGILSNLLNKSLLNSYLAVPIASDKFCGTQDLNDFKVATRYRLSAAGELEVVGNDATLKDFTLGEESWTNQLVTRGTKLTLPRQTLINDDLDAFTFIPRLIGRKSALAIERGVFTPLLANANQTDGNAFFSTQHNNFLSGAGSALSIAALASAVPLFLKQTDKQGEPIQLAPAYLLVPSELVVIADQLYKDTNVVTLLGTSTASGKVVPQSNPFAGKYRPIQSPYLSNGLITNNSSTGWYLIADPADVPMVSIGYLRGQRTPTVSQAMTDVSILGFTWQCYFDFGIGMVDWRAGVFNQGT